MALTDNTRGILFMSGSMAAFTVNDAMMKAATQTLPLMQAIAIRGVMSVLALVLLAQFLGGLTRPRGGDLRLLGWRTLGELGATLTFLTALMHMPLANLSAIMQSLPLAVTLGAALLLGEQVGWRRMLAIAAGFGGVLLIVRPGTDGFDIWSVVGLASVACVVLRDLTTRRMSTSLSSVTVATTTALAVTLMGVAGTLAGGGWTPVSPGDAARLATAALALVFGYLFVVQAMRVGDVAMVAPFRYTALLWAIVLGWLMFADWPDALTLAGAAVIVVSGLYAYLRENRLRRPVAAQAPAAPEAP